MNATAALRNVARTTDALLVDAWWAIAKAEAPVLAYEKIEARNAKEGRPFAYAAELATAREELAKAVAAAAPLEAIADAGRWSRFMLVPGGHLHRGFGCSTLRSTTRTGLMPEFSGAQEAEVVELAGERACTVCFPSAPVNRPSMLPVHVKEREEAAQERAEKAAAKTAAAAAAIPYGRTAFKTLRAAENAISWEIESVISRSYQQGVDEAHTAQLRNLAAEDRAEVEAIADAIEKVYPEWDRAAVLAKKFATKAKEYRKGGWDIPADASY